ncbi:MAG TPA: DUF6361 family protein [Gemmataceae bacterium]|nr:DUF6361 family protein [Gemmataceae bacterium]
MGSTFTWLDYSEHERRKMLDAIALLRERTTRDELGLGGVRDAFADLMFPGTSTVQTVAKYFLFVPWIYLALERKGTPSAKVALQARKAEIALAQELEESGETGGVIGRIAKETLQRLPSSIYWQGLHRWGIRIFGGSQDEYHRSLDVFYQRLRARKSGRHEHEGETADEPDLHNWHVGLPKPDDGFPEGAALPLNVEEARYLRERILANCSQSLLAYLVREHVDVEEIPFVWDLPQELPEKLRNQVEHGRNFSQTMHGAQLLYNLILAEKRVWSEHVDVYRGDLEVWRQRIEKRISALYAWDRQDFWRVVYHGNPRVSPRARSFVNSWLDLAIFPANVVALADKQAARQLVEDREVQLKGSLARVRNQRARDLWNGEAGAAQLDLRWTSARGIVSDILAGSEAKAHA